jgi:hypothetical protein
MLQRGMIAAGTMSSHVFVSERGSPLSVAGYQRMVARAGEAAKFGFLVHSHMMRHGCGYKLTNDGQDSRAIQHYLGIGPLLRRCATLRWRLTGSRDSGRTEVVLEPRLHRDYVGRGRTAMSTKVETTRCRTAVLVLVGLRHLCRPRGQTQQPDAARGRPPLGEWAMTPAERQRRRRAAQRKDKG